MKDFNEFVKMVEKDIKNYLPVEFETAQVDTITAKKNNLSLTGISVRTEDSNVAPVVYLNYYFEEVENGSKPIEDVMNDIASVVTQYSLPKTNFDETWITNWDLVKEYISKRVVGVHNKDLLEGKIYRVYEDIAALYIIVTPKEVFPCSDNDTISSIIVTTKMMEAWGITEDELEEAAIKNQMFQAEIISMNEIIKSMEVIEPDMIPDNPMYVLTNVQKVNGAALITDKTVMKLAVDLMGDNLIILPSSVHEVILLPSWFSEMDEEALKYMVEDINITNVAPEERLTDSVYRYTLAEGLKKIA